MKQWIIVVMFGALASACSESAVTDYGHERQACYPNSTCNPGLRCLSGLCVRLHDGGEISGDGGSDSGSVREGGYALDVDDGNGGDGAGGDGGGGDGGGGDGGGGDGGGGDGGGGDGAGGDRGGDGGGGDGGGDSGGGDGGGGDGVVLGDLGPEDAALADVLPPDAAPPCTGCVITVAGNGNPGFADGPALSAQLRSPAGLALVGDVLYIADRDNHRIRTLEGGELHTIAGTGKPGFRDGDALSEAQFLAPSGVTISNTGIIYIADSGNHRIRKLSGKKVGTHAGTGSPGSRRDYRLAATFNSPRDVAIDPFGVLYVADALNNRVRIIRPGYLVEQVHNPYRSGGYFMGCLGLGMSRLGELMVAESQSHALYRISTGATTHLIAGIRDQGGFIDGSYETARFLVPSDVAADDAGRFYMVDSANHRIRIRDGDQVTTLAGTGEHGFADGPTATAKFFAPLSVAVNGPGTRVYISDVNNHRIRLILLDR